MKTNQLLRLRLIWALLVGLVALAVQASAVPIQAAPDAMTWYVDAATGDDGNDCQSTGSACQTVGTAVARAADGDTVQIAAGVYEESVAVNVPLTLVGAGPESTFLDGGGAQRVLFASHNPVSVQSLTVRNGHVSNENGGGIANGGTLILQDVRVTGNMAVGGGGAGIYNVGILVLINSEVSGNSSDGAGGGIFSWYGSTTSINVSRVDGNSGHAGGGLFNLGTLTIDDSTVGDNVATGDSGGGLTIFEGSVMLNSVTFSGNQAANYGGAIGNALGTLSLTNSTISGNSAAQYGGLATTGAQAQTAIVNSTIAYNTASGSGNPTAGLGGSGQISLQNSIVAHNGDKNCNGEGIWTSEGHNLSTDYTCAFSSSGDLPGTPALLAPLASSNGSPTEVHGLLPGSAAIDGGDDGACPSRDQRGVTRPVDGDGDGVAVCDMGSFEARNQLTAADTMVTEGDNGVSTVVFVVTLSPAAGQTVTVDYATEDGTAQAGSDYDAVNGALTFGPGETEQLVGVEVWGDTDDEADKRFYLTLSSAVNADIVDAQAEATIIDDDGLPSLTIAGVTVTEGHSSQTVAQLLVALSPVSSETVTVDYATADGTAVAGEDYAVTSGTLVLAPGETSALVEVLVAGDDLDEGDEESFKLQLSNAANANVVAGEAVVTILDDDTAKVGLQPGPQVQEGQSGTGTAVFRVNLSAATAFAVNVAYETANSASVGSATAGVDYEPTSGLLTFAPGETDLTVSVTVYGDSEEEGDERFELFLSNADPVPIYANTASATILDDEDVNLLFLPAFVGP